MMNPTLIGSFKILSQYNRNAIAMRTHTNQFGYLVNVVGKRALMKVAPVKHPPVGKILKRLQVPSMGLIVPNVKLVVVHFRPKLPPKKKPTAGGGDSLFGTGISHA